jgi:hypothetical protein
MSEPGRGLYDHLYKRYVQKRDAHQGYEFQQAPVGNVPPPTVTFAERLKWWTLDRWRRLRRVRAERDRLQQEILRIKDASQGSGSGSEGDTVDTHSDRRS